MRACLLVLLVACAKPIGTNDATPPPPTTQPVLLVANKADANVSLLELPGGRLLAQLPTGVGPHEIAVSKSGRTAVISDYGDQQVQGKSLTVIDLPSLTVARTIDLGEYRRPHGIAFLADDRRVIVTTEANAAVVIVDVEAGTVERGIPTGQPLSHMVALSGDRTRAYTGNITAGTVTPIDLATYTAGESVTTLPMCEGIGVTVDGSEVWSASLKENKILILDARALAPAGEVETAGAPIRVVPTPDGKSMLVAAANGSAVQIVDVATRAVETVEMKPLAGPTAAPVGMVVAPDSKTAYVALVAEDRVAVIDLARRSVAGHLPTGRGPDGIGYSAVFVR